ncbi:AraC-like transcriptional regulator QhpR [Stappia indica]|uniref:AraC-like transcriptional regulator QhpR n=1 Tax=Stappia indica TaxID=538381 RepID=UPI001CD6B3A0|nr:AraC family transcriptional regulator [Stappia indica]MCA1297121.1 AraC family transcriptional regulator [Stappia indica]
MQQPVNSCEFTAPSKVLSAAANGAKQLFRACGGDIDRILGQTGIRHEDFENPVSEVNLSQYCHMFEVAAQQTGNHNIGLHFGKNFQPKQLGMLGYAAISSPTLAAGLRHMETYFPAHQGQTTFGLLPDDGVLWLSYQIVDPRVVNRRQDAELSLGMFCNVFRAALGEDWAPLEVRFEHAAPDDGREHERLFNAPVRFGRRTNAIAFRRKDLDAKMPDQDPYLFSVVKAFLESRNASVEDPTDFATLVRNQVKLNLGSRLPTLPEIASVLGLSCSSFQKQLRRHGLAFPDILKAARHELALHYMDDPDMSLTEIAYNLGYSEQSAFTRAFRNWTGMSPQRYRRL